MRDQEERPESEGELGEARESLLKALLQLGLYLPAAMISVAPVTRLHASFPSPPDPP